MENILCVCVLIKQSKLKHCKWTEWIHTSVWNIYRSGICAKKTNCENKRKTLRQKIKIKNKNWKEQQQQQQQQHTHSSLNLICLQISQSDGILEEVNVFLCIILIIFLVFRLLVLIKFTWIFVVHLLEVRVCV